MDYEEKRTTVMDMTGDDAEKEFPAASADTDKDCGFESPFCRDDGNLNAENVESIAESAKTAVKDAVDRLKGLRHQVHSDLREACHAAEEALELREAEREIRQSRRQAEAEHQDAVRQLKSDVAAETKELKELLKWFNSTD